MPPEKKHTSCRRGSTVLQKSIMLRILADRMIKRLPHDRYLRRAHEASEVHQQIFVTSKKKTTPTTKQNKKILPACSSCGCERCCSVGTGGYRRSSPAATPVQLNRNRCWNLGELPCLRSWQRDWTCVQCEFLLRPRVPPPTRTLSGYWEWARLNRHRC